MHLPYCLNEASACIQRCVHLLGIEADGTPLQATLVHDKVIKEHNDSKGKSSALCAAV